MNNKYNKLDLDGRTIMSVLENSIIKKNRDVENFDLLKNYEIGSIDIWRNRIIADEIQESNNEISLSSAKQIESDFEVGEEVTEPFDIKLLTLPDNFYLKRIEHYNILLYNNFKTRIGDIVVGQVFQDLIIRDDNHNDFMLPKKEQMFNDFIEQRMRKRENIRAIIKNVYWADNQPIIIFSRTVPNFLQKLLEQEIPEILDGFIIVKQVVRIPGEKSKVSVLSSDFHIDPVSACLGVKGIRIKTIVKELKTENIDVIKYSINLKGYIMRALSPTNISMIKIYEQKKTAIISLKYEQVSKVVGRKGKNIRLAGKITGYKIIFIRNY